MNDVVKIDEARLIKKFILKEHERLTVIQSKIHTLLDPLSADQKFGVLEMTKLYYTYKLLNGKSHD